MQFFDKLESQSWNSFNLSGNGLIRVHPRKSAAYIAFRMFTAMSLALLPDE